MALDVVSRSANAGRARASIATPAGEWVLGWDHEMATFWAMHRRMGSGGVALARAPDQDLGGSSGACPSVGALQEALGFPLPRRVREALVAEREQRPALALPRSTLVPDSATALGIGIDPVWESIVTVFPGGDRSRYGLELERERPVGAADLGSGTRLEILAAELDAGAGGHRVEYRLTHESRVVFAGDDIHAPVTADLADDASLRALLGVLVDPDAPHRNRDLSDVQSAFVQAHGERLRSAVASVAHPYGPGTRVATVVDGVHYTGVVTYAATRREGDREIALAYAWRPDTADLVGHPWRHHPDHALVSSPEALTSTMAPPFVAHPRPGQPLVFGAIVATPDPDTGLRVEATVLRAYPDQAGGFLYQVQPHDADLAEPFVVGDGDCAVVQGTWWPDRAGLVAARKQAGVDIAPGEQLTLSDGDAHLTVVPAGNGEPPVPTRDEQLAALLVDVGEPLPTTVKLSTHGSLTRLGDPDHGWMVIDTDRWAAAMTRDPADLREALEKATPAGTVLGHESKLTLAALAASHIPDELGPAPMRLVENVATANTAAAEVDLWR